MAAFNYDDYGDSGSGGSLVAALNWAGAFLSVVLIAGLATWGWKLWVRDVSGVPVVRALEGPMRVAPEDPGGLASEYQGLSVNRIAEERVEESAAERVVLAPQPEVLVEDEDLTMAELQPMIDIDYRLGPRTPEGLQDGGIGIVHDTLVSVAGFNNGSGPGGREFHNDTWGLDLNNPAATWADGALPS